MQKYEPNSSLSSRSHYLVETGAFTAKREADSGSRNIYVLGWRRTSEAGHCSEIGPSKAFLTASAFLASGTLQTQAFARNNPVQVMVTACKGTDATSLKWPSPACCRRQASSRVITFTVLGSSKSATGGSLKAI